MNPEDITIDNILKSYPAWSRISKVMAHKRKLLVHPKNYSLIANGIKEFYPEGQLKSHMFYMGMGGIEIVQDSFVPLTTTVRKRRFLSKKQREKWFVRKWRKVEIPVLGWWMDDYTPFGG